ncbi:MAG: glycoside hydrolase family 28 protein [Clostridia bacterium]|nr:glycoside hydrolase family 28 protein [Clostridia bacterium]
MELAVIFTGNRSAAVELRDGGLYHTLRPYRLTLNGSEWGEADTVSVSLYGLTPATDYTLRVHDGDSLVGEVSFTTAEERVTLDVRAFGAEGDGVHEDTAAIQAAILCCPPGGRVLIPAGTYLVTPLFLKSHIRLEVQKGATLKLRTEREAFPILPGRTDTSDGGDLLLGTWEGDPQDCFAALLTGVDCEDVLIWGEGVLDGSASRENWWHEPKKMRVAWRGRMLFLCRCKNVTVQGLTVRNSPSWNLHPYFSDDLRFIGMTVEAPADSPNTDGFDPESCRGVLLSGMRFSLGDDCIAIKSGKIWMGEHYHVPCEDLEIRHCLMENGHGGLTVGSEMAGGVKNVRVHDCLMRRTDRGLRVKTRRGRGEWGVVDGILFERVRMERVLVPLVVNAMYFCDPDGHSPWVQSREKQPVDHTTPTLGSVTYRDVEAVGCACAGYVLGLPERPMKQLTLERVTIDCAPDAPAIAPAMSEGVPQVSRHGLEAHFVEKLTLREVAITGCETPYVLDKDIEVDA